MIRQALRMEKERELEKETGDEIKEELALVAKLCEARKEWRKFQESSWKDIPKCAQRDYENIYDDMWTREKYGELDEALLKEIAALALVKYTDEVFFDANEPFIYAFARSVLAYRKNLIRWKMLNETLRNLKYSLSVRSKISEITLRLLERLSELPENACCNHEIKEKLLRPIAKIMFEAHPQSPPTITKIMQRVAQMRRLEFNKIAHDALRRMEMMLERLPNPNSISCETAMRRVIKMHESNLTDLDVDIPKDGAALDHIISCGKKCAVLFPYVHDKNFGRIQPKLPDNTEDCKKAIERAKELLTTQAQSV